MPRLPTLQTGKRVLLLLRAPDLDQRVLEDPPLRRLHPGRLAALLLIMRRPRRITQSAPLVFGR
jgi:hypothetical protein